MIEQRIIGDQVENNAKGWRLQHVLAFEEFRAWMTDEADLVIDTSSLTASDVADRVLGAAFSRPR